MVLVLPTYIPDSRDQLRQVTNQSHSPVQMTKLFHFHHLIGISQGCHCGAGMLIRYYPSSMGGVEWDLDPSPAVVPKAWFLEQQLLLLLLPLGTC